MEPSDRLAYRIQVTHSGVTTDYAYKMTSADVTIKANAIPLLTAILDNSDLYFTSATRVSDKDAITLQASRDGGATYFTLFYGRVSDRTGAMDSEGKETYTINAEGAGALGDMFISPDQVVIGPTDVSLIGASQGYGNIFQGRPGDQNGDPWGADSQGNYPDGLLYKTGYALDPSSYSNFIPTSLDILAPMMFDGSTSTYDAIKYICGLYGANFFFDDQNKRIIVRKVPVQGDTDSDYPSAGVSIVRGLTLNTITTKDLGYETYDKITVIGATPSNFFTVGTGPKELIQKETSLTDRAAVIAKAYQLYARRGAQKGATVSAPAIGESVIGKRVDVIDEVHNPLSGGRRPFGNVVGVAHQLAKDRWLTTLDMECLKRDTPLILAEIKTEQEAAKTETSLGQMYLNPRAAGNGNQGSYGNIVAMGAGNASSNFVVKPIEDVATDPDGATKHAYLTLGSGVANGRINRFRLYGNNQTNGALATKTVITEFARGSPSTDAAGNRWLKVCDTPDELSGYWPINITSVSGLNGHEANIKYFNDQAGGYITRLVSHVNSYSFNVANASRIRYIAGTAASQASAIPIPQDAKWDNNANAGGLGQTISDSTQLYNAMVDFTEGIVITLEQAQNAHGIMIMFEWDTKLGDPAKAEGDTTSYFGLEGVVSSVLTALAWAGTNSGSPIVEFWVWDANNGGNGTPSWIKYDTYSGSYLSSFSALGPSYVATLARNFFVSVTGKIRILLRTYNDGAQLSLHVGYVSAAANVNAGAYTATTSARRIERCIYNPQSDTFSLSYTPSKVNGFYCASNDLGNGSFQVVGPNLLGLYNKVGERTYQRPTHQVGYVRVADNTMPMWNGRKADWYLETQGWILADYSVDSVQEIEGPSVPTMETSDYKVVWKDALRQRAEIWVKVNKNTPAYGTYLAVEYSCVGGPVISEATVDGGSRIGVGIDKCAHSQANVCYTLASGAGNPGTIKGLGVDSP